MGGNTVDYESLNVEFPNLMNGFRKKKANGLNLALSLR